MKGAGRAARRVLRAAVALAAGCGLVLAAVVVPATSADRGRQAGLGGTVRQAGKKAVGDEACDPTASLRPSSADGPAVKRIRKRGYLIAAVDQMSYLWGYRNPATGRVEGFDIDLVRAVAKDILGDADKVRYVTTDTDRRFRAVRSGQVDLMARTTTATCERIERERVAFSTVYFETGQQLIVPKTSSITGFGPQLAGKRVCVGAGTTAYDLLRQRVPGARVITVDNGLDCLVLIQLHQADAVFTHSSLGASQVAQDPTVHLVGEPVGSNPYRIVLNPRDTDLVRRVNKVLEDYRDGGTKSAWTRSYDRWLAALLPDDPKGPPPARYRD